MKEKQFGFLEFLLNFLFGAILGGVFGFGLWVGTGRSGLLWHVFHYDAWSLYYSYPAACLFIGGGALVGGVLFALYKGDGGYW